MSMTLYLLKTPLQKIYYRREYNIYIAVGKILYTYKNLTLNFFLKDFFEKECLKDY